MQTGLLSLLGLPYAYRFLVAPVMDRCSPLGLGRRRGWMMLTQLVLLLGFNILAWFHPATDARTIMWFALWLSCCSAIQDVVIDAQRIEYLPVNEHGLGAAFAVLGYRIAMLVGGGVALVLAYHYGWGWTYRLMGGGMGIGLVAAWWSKEPVPVKQKEDALTFNDWILPIKDWVQRPGWLGCIGFILLYKLGEAFTSTSSGIMMPFLRQGLDFPLDTIGYVNKGIGVVALLLGGVTAGWWLRKKPLFQALLWFGLFQAMANALFLFLAMMGHQLWLFVLAVLVDNWAAGMGSTALVALLMRLVNQQFTATQFSLLIAVSLLPRIFSGPIAAVLQMHFGWAGLFGWAFGFSFLFIPFLLRMRTQHWVSTPES